MDHNIFYHIIYVSLTCSLNPSKAKSDLTQKKLTDEINPLETDLRKLTLNHREAELELRGRKFRLETEVEGLIAKYDDVS